VSAVEPGYAGNVGATVPESTPWWPEPRQHGDRPNVVVILLDDVGFAQLGCYGASIDTPHMDALASQGLRYTNFHATALCSPTRASLLTGRNHHSVGMGFLAAFDTGFPNYRGRVTPHAATMAEVLRDEGYGTYALGKWHLTPPAHLTSAGPFDTWPTQRGFDRYYGFLGGEEDQWAPELWYDQHLVDTPQDDGYHLSEDLVDRARQFLNDHRTSRPDDPFLLYLSFGACHAPHQAPREYIERYRGAFDHGWDVERERVLARQKELGVVPPDTDLAPRNPDVASWDDVDARYQQVYARLQEAFAGFMTHTDDQIGRLVQYLRDRDLFDDTLIVLMSDNGASGEGGPHGTANEYRWFLRLSDTPDDTLAALDAIGGPDTHNHYPTGWAQAGNTPMRFYKRYAYGGGVRVPMIVSWPTRVSAPGLRSGFHHVIDVMPTILEACGASLPDSFRGREQMPLHGRSILATLTDADAEASRPAQYFETAGYRGIVSGDFKAIARHRPGDDFDDDRWELYRLFDDVSEVHDLAEKYPDRAADLASLWWEQARTYGVLPLDDRMQTRMMAQNPAKDHHRYEMLPGTRLMNPVVGPNFFERGFRIVAEVQPWEPGDDGVLLAWGRRPTGMTLFVKDGALRFDLNLGGRHTTMSAPTGLDGATRLGFCLYEHQDEVVGKLLVDDDVAAHTRFDRLIPGGMGLLPTQCGYNAPSPVSPDYRAPFAYDRLVRVVVDLQPRDPAVTAADWLAVMAQQ
jgi:arylsulfatase